MKAITLWQPWATMLCIPQIKPHETRSWRMPESLIGEPVAIHAAKRRVHMEEVTKQMLMKVAAWLGPLRRRPTTIIDAMDFVWTLPRSAVVGVVTFGPSIRTEDADPGEVGRMWGDYSCGRWAWPTTSAQLIKPVTCNGRQRIWTLDQEIERAVRERMEGLK